MTMAWIFRLLSSEAVDAAECQIIAEHALEQAKPLSLPQTPSERSLVVRATDYIHFTRRHQLTVSPTQVTPAQVTPVQVTPV